MKNGRNTAVLDLCWYELSSVLGSGVMEVEDGKFGDGYMVIESLGRLKQIGVVPTPEEANQA